MTDTDLLKNTRNTRSTTGIEWCFSLCTADEGDSDSEPDDASAGSDGNSIPSSGPPVSEELRFVRDLDLAARHDTATFKSNPWTIAKLRAATRKPPLVMPSTELSELPPVPPEALTSTPASKPRLILDPHAKKSVEIQPPQPTLCGKKPTSQNQKISPPRTKRKLGSVPNPMAMHPNPDCLLGVSSEYLDPLAIYNPSKTAGTHVAQPLPCPIEKRNAATPRKQKEENQPSSFEVQSKGPPFPSPVSVRATALLGHINPSPSPVKQSSLHSTTHIPNRFNLPNRLPDPLILLPRPSTGNPSYGLSTPSPVKPRSPAALSTNRAGTKRKRPPSPLRSKRPVDTLIPNLLPTATFPRERVPLKTPVHRQRVSAYDSEVFDSADEEWSTLPQRRLRSPASKDPTTMMRDSFRIPGVKLPGIGNQISKKSWLLTTFQPPPPLNVPSMSTENPKENDSQIPPSENVINTSSQTVVENENGDDE